MTRLAILYCKRIKDHSCVACAKCFKGMAERNGEFARYEQVELVAMTDCGDCPGLVLARLKHLSEAVKALGREFDVVHLGTCVQLAIETAQCPIDLDELQPVVEAKFGVPLRLGTHSC